MVGGGLPVAEQVKVTSTASSSCSVLEVCTAVVTSEIPGQTSEMSHVAKSSKSQTGEHTGIPQ